MKKQHYVAYVDVGCCIAHTLHRYITMLGHHQINSLSPFSMLVSFKGLCNASQGDAKHVIYSKQYPNEGKGEPWNGYVFCFGFFSHISERVAQFFEVPRYVSAKGVAKQANYRWCACDVMAAILDELLQKHLINFYCMWNQHGRRIIVLCILRNWLQPTY